jgi:hypothetical protein
VGKLKEVGAGLVMCDVTMFEFSVGEVGQLLLACPQARILV